MFWKLQNRLAAELCRRLPDKAPAEAAAAPQYLNANMLLSAETALMALSREIRHLDKAGMEVMCHALFVPPQLLYDDETDGKNLPAPVPPLHLDVPQLYETRIKPLFSAILDFTGRLDLSENAHQEQLTRDHTAAWRIVETVKESQHLQKNMQQYLTDAASPAAADYLRLRRHVFQTLRLFCRADDLPSGAERAALLDKLRTHTDSLETFLGRVMVKLRNKELNGWQASSLLNDINYARRIGLGVAEILQSRTIENAAQEEGAAAA